MKKEGFFIIDFDSTFVKVEALDELAKIVLEHSPKKEKIVKQISEITQQGMEGKLDFPESLAKRTALLPITKTHIETLVTDLKTHITSSVVRNKEFFKTYASRIYIISGGFKEYIAPIVREYGIQEDHVLANTFIFNKDKVTGYDKKNLLSQKDGKAKQLNKLGLKGKITIIGDGYTDFEAKQSGEADTFIAFVENIKRDAVLQKADISFANFDELLYSYNLPRAYSYPKSKMKVLLLENIEKTAIDRLKNEGYIVEALPKALDEKELSEAITDISILGIRSKTEVTAAVLKHAKKLLTIGAFCIGTNQIDLSSAASKGVCVFNAPYSNTRSVVELAMGEIIMLSRKTFDKSTKLHQGVWDKSAMGSHEVRGKKLGIIGYGNIGSQLSVIAEMMGMEVYFYDLIDKLALGNAKKCNTLEELLSQVDYVTVHIDGRKSNAKFIAEKEFQSMKDGVIFLNLSRGFVVDIEALTNALTSGKVAGAAVDVFPHEPKSNKEPFVSPLQTIPNVILTPHVGGSTEEAQRGIAEFVSTKIIDFIDTGTTTLSVNFPQIQLPSLTNAHRCIHIHQNVPGMMAKINNILAKRSINIEGQYLKTNEDVGYVITDINKDYNPKVIDELKQIEGTIKVRILY